MVRILVLVLSSTLVFTAAAAGQECSKTFDSTFDLLREAVFEGRGCTSVTCHTGPNAAGELDLSGDDAWDNLIDVDASTVPAGLIDDLKRVVPGQKDASLLWLNLAAATLPGQWEAPLRAMPLVLEPLSLDELEAVRLWIEQGAPKDGVVPGTDELLDACLPEPKPIRIEPLPAPAAGTGVQLQMPQWVLPPTSEDEVCFVSYFDIDDQVPEQFRGPSGNTFRYVRNQIRQNPGSHHLIVNLYLGTASIEDPRWGAFTCKGGPSNGETCDPTNAAACDGGLCGSEPQTALACVGFGPGDVFTNSAQFTGTQESSSSINFIDGVFAEVPTKGILVWNSHAFNLTREDSILEAWINFEFAENQTTPAEGIFNIENIFAMNVPPFTAQEVCGHHQLRTDARVFELNSHMHQRGQRFRIFDAMFTCQGGSNDGAACSPMGADETFQTDGQCGSAACASKVRPPFGDCNNDSSITITDLTRAVNVALGNSELRRCEQADTSGDGKISVAELVALVRAALAGDRFVDPDESLVYTSFEYNDPLTKRYDPPLAFGGNGEGRAARTMTYCAVYDNGMADPTTVKRKSTSPPTPNDVGFGGPCAVPTGCTEGQVGATCSGGDQAERDASCDTSPGLGDGVCDACVLTGGVTTEDEMFVLIGSYFRDR